MPRLRHRLAPVFALAAALCLVPAAAARAQGAGQPDKPAAAAPATYEVAKGDTLYRVATRTRPAGVTVFQMIVALYRANPEAFLDGNVNQLVVGRTLKIPSRETIAGLGAAEAAQEYRTLIAKPASPAAAQPAPGQHKEPAPPAKPRSEPGSKPKPTSAALSPEQAAERYEQGLKAERVGDLRAALDHFLAAGESGNGAAQKRLGDLYNTGNAVVSRDYETALRWYQKARAQGVEIPKPITHPTVRPPN